MEGGLRGLPLLTGSGGPPIGLGCLLGWCSSWSVAITCKVCQIRRSTNIPAQSASLRFFTGQHGAESFVIRQSLVLLSIVDTIHV